LLDVAVIHLPHISNFDDFDPLRFEPGVHVRFVRHLQKLGHPDALFLPGSKNTIRDLAWLEKNGFANAIRALAAAGVPVIGFCGGFQMMGTQVQDEGHIESDVASLPGLGLLPVSTCMASQKTVTRSHARIQTDKGFFAAIKDEMVAGYEIHLGRSEMQHPLVEIIRREGEPVSALDGACSADGKLWGCHLHALLENDHLRWAWLESMGVAPSPVPFKELRQKAYDGLADALEAALDMALLDSIIQGGA
jgi:adenosylcobyric acid synthase